MKNKNSNYLWKVITAAFLTVMLAIGVSYVADVNVSDTYAAEEVSTEVVPTPADVDYKLIKYSDISAYRVKDQETGLYTEVIPQYSDSEGIEWLFAGWFSVDNTSNTIGTEKTTGEAVAKFVPADVLSVKCQLSEGTDAESSTTVLRCVSSVDTLKYNQIGFDLTVPNSETFAPKHMASTKVGSRIKVSDENKKDAYAFSPKVIDTESEYFFSATYKVVKENEAFDTRYLVKPYWITQDGTKVYGVSRYVSVNEGITTKTIYASVKMAEPTSEEFSVSSPATSNEYLGYVGGYAHFALTVSDRTALDSVTKFTVYDSDDVVLGTYDYRNLSKKYNGSNADQSWYTAYEGTSEDEFVIATNADLYGFSVLTADSDPSKKMPLTGKTIYLCADIEANEGEANVDGWTGDTSYTLTPIATGTPFDGVFDGQGHTISGINVNTGIRAGLFAWTGENSVIQNFNLSNSYFTSGTSANAGSIVGRVDGKISNVSSNAIVVGDRASGGIAGNVFSEKSGNVQIENCQFAGSVSTNGHIVGGIVGTQGKGKATITNCTVSGQVSAGLGYAGGIFGTSDAEDKTGEHVNVEITGCTVTDTACITANKDYTGGLVGYIAKGTLNIKSSQFKGSVESPAGSYGGFVGAANGGTTLIESCSASDDATVIGTKFNQAGGIVGRVATGTVTIEKSSFGGTLTAQQYVGGLAGTVVSGGTLNINNSSFTGELNATQYAGGLVGRVENGNVTIDSSSYVTGTISTSGVKVNDETMAYTGGLIGDKNGGEVTIQNCYSGAIITANGNNKGGLVGAVSSGSITIENSYFSGELTGLYYYAGGILGNVISDDIININKCYSSGTVRAAKTGVGGILGNIMSGTVNMNNCLNTGNVSTEDAGAAGLVGRTQGGKVNINYCLNRGTIVGPHAIGSVVGWKQSGTVIATSVYATTTNTATDSSKTWYYSEVPIGNDKSSTYEGVTMIGLTDITVSTEKEVTVDDVTAKLKGFDFNTIWMIGTTDGSRPELNLTQ